MTFFFISILFTTYSQAQINVFFSRPDGEEVCQGGATSVISLDVIAVGGSIIYTDYDWTDPDGVIVADFGASIVLTIANPGSFAVSVTVTDDEGTQGSGTFNFTVKPGPESATITPQGPLNFCDGGSVELVATFGADYTYQWRNLQGIIAGATNQSYIATTANQYRVVITAPNECSRTSSAVTVTVYDNPEPVATNSGPVCENGTVQFFAEPDGLVSYQWTGPESFSVNEQNPVLTNIPLNFAGVYNVTVTDSNNCIGSASTTLVVEPLPEAPTSADVDRNDICADDTGDISLTATGGSGDRLVWYSGSCGGTFVGEGTEITIARPANTTTFFARWESDGACPESDCVSVEVRIRPIPQINFDNTHVSCNGGNDGSSTAIVSDATGPFSYIWDTDPVQTTQTASNLTAGDYTVTVTDVFGCTNSETTTITEPDLLTVNIGNISHVECFEESNGSAQAIPSGGTPPYSYVWNTTPVQTTQTATNLPAGIYMVTVTDANNCQETAQVEITEPDELTIQVISLTEPSCAGDDDGSITVEASGGTGNYIYLWSDGQTGPTASGLTAGNYSVTVTDENNCSEQIFIDLDEPLPLTVNITDVEDVECFGDETGSATATVSGGTGPYSFLWSDGQTTQTAVNLGSGDYNVTVTDANGCISFASVTINENNPIEISAIVNDASCFGFDDGSIILTVSGGSGPGTYSFAWSNGVTTQDNPDIPAGSYTVVVTDANLCTAEDTYVVNEPDSIVITETITPVTCFGDSDGEINVIVAGGTPPYTYEWSTGASTPVISGLTSGNYDLTVTDANNCIVNVSYFVPQPDPITYDVEITDVFCASESTGTIEIFNVQGGTPPYSFDWSNGESGQFIENLTAGFYTLTITDAEGCTSIETFEVTEPDNPLFLDIITTDVICWGQSNGTAQAVPSGGTPFPGDTYEYLWSNGATTAFIENLGVGTYTVTVTDAQGCTIEGQAVINQPSSPLEAYAGSNQTICSGANEGLHVLGGTGLTPTALGGTEPYTYQWISNPADPSLAGQENLSNPIVSPLVQTTYTVIVTDDGGCVAQDNAVISVFPTVVADAGGDADGNIYLCEGGSTPLGGTPLGEGNTGYYLENPDINEEQFNYRWERISPNPEFISNEPHPLVSPTVTTSYFVRVSDKAGDNCIAYDTVTVVIIPAIIVEAIDDASVCNGNNEGVGFTLGATISGGTGDPDNYEILWTAVPDDPTLAGQETLLNPVVSPVVTTVYTITVTDSEGIACSDSDDVTITVFPEIIADAGEDATICHPANGGSIELGGSPAAYYADGSAGTFTYQWTSSPAGFSSNESNPLVSPSQTTTYFLTVTDVNGCQETSEVTITVMNELIADAGEDLEMCHPENDGQVQLNGSASGGTPGYTYLWEPTEHLSDPNIANPIATPLATTVYTLTVTDEFGCVAIDQMTVTVIDEVIASITGDDLICHPDDGGVATLTASGAGGSGSFNYLWSAVPPYDFEGNENNAVIVVNPEQTTLFSVIITDQDSGCEDSASFEVEVLDQLIVNLVADENICHPDNTSLPGTEITANVSGGSGNYSYFWSTGETTQTIFVEPTTTTSYTVQVTDNDTGCTTEQMITIEVFDELLADAGDDITVCYLNPVVLEGLATGGSGTGYTYLWTPSTGLSDPTILNPVFISPAEFNEGGSITFTLTITDSNGCIASDEVNVDILPEIIVDPGTSQDVCFGSDFELGGTPTANGGSGNFNYFWTVQSSGVEFSNDPNPVINIDFTGTETFILLVHDVDGDCFETAEVTLTVIDEPTVVITADPEEACEGELVTLTATGADTYVWTSDPPYDFEGIENDAQIQVTLSETTTFFVAGTNICGSDLAEITITVIPGPVVDLGEDLEACDGEVVTLDAGEFVNSTYLWSDGSTEQTLEVTETGTYSVVVTSLDTNCSSFDEIFVFFNPLPLAFTGDDQTICMGDEVMLGADDADNPVPNNTYLWLSDPEDPSISDPTISNPVVSPMVTTTYTLIETYLETGCTNSNTVVVTVVGGIPNAGEDQTICAGESVALGPDTPIDGNIYTWTSSNEEEEFDSDVPNPVVTPMVTTTYTLIEEYTEFGCINTATVTITVNPTPLAETGPDLNICPGDTVMIGTEYTEPMPPNTYLWTSEPEDPSISDPTVSNPWVSPAVTTVYTLTETFVLTGCTNQNTITVTLHEIPFADIIEDSTVCQSEEIELGSDMADPLLTYLWSSVPEGFVSTEANPTVIPGFYPLDANNQITFILDVSNEYCSNRYEAVITVEPDPVPDIMEDLVFCTAEEAQNTEIGGEAVPNYTYFWESDQDDGFSSTESNPVVSPLVTTVYTLYVTDTENGCMAEYQVQITISDLEIILSQDPAVCESETFIYPGDFVTINGGIAPYQFFWTDAAGNNISNEFNPEVSAPFSESYTLSVIDQMGCPASISFSLEVIDDPVVSLNANGSPAGSTLSIYLGQNVIFEAIPAGYERYDFYLTDTEGQGDDMPEQSGSSNIFSPMNLLSGQSVYVIAYNEGCTDISQVVTIVVNDLPNAFTPDGDGINDIFAEGQEVTVFNRWGQKIFEGTRGWDGTFNGRRVAPGTYYYLLNLYDENNNRTTVKGSITVVLNEN